MNMKNVINDTTTKHIIDAAMKIVSKDVQSPKVVREGNVKLKK